MALLNLGKKKEAPVQEAPPNTTPTNEVVRLRQQGLSNNQIVQALQRSGYKTHQIFDAMNQADMSSAAPVAIPPSEQAQMEPIGTPPGAAPEAEYSKEPATSSDERIEEVAEAIIDEKWQEIVKNVNKIVEWKNATESRIRTIEAQNEVLKRGFESLQKALFDRVERYDKNVADVGTNLKAMEQVFSKILPTFTSNVNELSRITRGIKGKKPVTK